ncbi:MAG TPA: biotin carboxylase N-terminal domain-containing protein [Fimbriimonas sp.]|nr:biotin carboxylase N-terminal domain-containing protein [Fimbriimonas sp.]
MKKLLIANRGEIAVRVIRAAREMGIRTVAVYSDADREATHVKLADDSVHIGGSEPSASYLDMDAVLDAARATGADAIHPGYGFLSERAEFAEAVEAAGIKFVGPSADAMRKLGSKSDAKALAIQVGVPIVPGLFDPHATPEQLRRAADDIGYPVMLKASAGGGGRGMRAVHSADDFESELTIASDEALKGFGDGTMMVEKRIHHPRHIEVQIIADDYGNVAPLFERECSLQRRHQKLVEEAPAARPIPWEAMREAAVKLIRAAGYRNAGTVEFMVDPATGEFYFLEVNARLQVEHPVTELVTGIDLVKWQLRVASGAAFQAASPSSVPPASSREVMSEALLQGDRSALNGHALEVRIVAEDPARNFLPSVGKILAWAEPRIPGIRVDTGYGPDTEIPRFYDSLIAKVIAHGATRAEAIDKLRQALLDFHILGIQTNIAYLLDLLDHPAFRSGDFDTGFLGREFADWAPTPSPLELGIIAASATQQAHGEKDNAPQGAWALNDGFRNAR